MQKIIAETVMERSCVAPSWWTMSISWQLATSYAAEKFSAVNLERARCASRHKWIQYSQKPDMAIDSGTAVYCPKLLSLLISRSLLSHRDKSRVARVGNAHRIKYYCVRDALRIILNTWLLELCSSTSNCGCHLIFDDFKMIFILWF